MDVAVVSKNRPLLASSPPSPSSALFRTCMLHVRLNDNTPALATCTYSQQSVTKEQSQSILHQQQCPSVGWQPRADMVGRVTRTSHALSCCPAAVFTETPVRLRQRSRMPGADEGELTGCLGMTWHACVSASISLSSCQSSSNCAPRTDCQAGQITLAGSAAWQHWANARSAGLIYSSVDRSQYTWVSHNKLLPVYLVHSVRVKKVAECRLAQAAACNIAQLQQHPLRCTGKSHISHTLLDLVTMLFLQGSCASAKLGGP